VVATIHPSAIPRAPDDEARHRMRRELVADVEVVARVCGDFYEVVAKDALTRSHAVRWCRTPVVSGLLPSLR
jgi:hypothetical protein